MFVQREENQKIGYFGSNEKNQTIELGDQVCLSLEDMPEVEVVAEVTQINMDKYHVKIVEFESDDSTEKLPLKLGQALDIESNLIQYCYKKEA
ncbi:MAG: hypothetical protein KC646_00880 [Candidatus Cloacimonetes bacterium]|nr:hypothetical protein [Candidatus Cloacimonadota bacterium]